MPRLLWHFYPRGIIPVDSDSETLEFCWVVEDVGGPSATGCRRSQLATEQPFED